MKGRILVSLFALPFFGVGVWMLWSLSSTFYDAYQMRGWQPTEATLTTAGYETHSGGDTDTYEAYARYTYNYRGQTFSGDRVALGGGGDNIGDYQQDLGRSLSATMARGETVTVYVNHENPSQAIIDPTLRWGLIGFKSIFLFVFGGVGLFLLIAAWRMPKEKDASLPEYQDSPWLLNDDWQTSSIRSNSKMSMWAAWAFAGIWNLISAAMPFVVYREIVKNENYLALVALLFPLVGVGLLVWAIRRTREWRRFGATPVTLDPFPGSIGGHVGGTIDLKLPYDPSAKFHLTLTNIHSYESGSGDSSKQSENAKWQDDLVAHVESSVAGTRLQFRFDVPEGLTESNAVHSGKSDYLWRLNLRGKLHGTNLDRDFEIPVYATATQSKRLSDRAVDQAKADQDSVYDQDIRSFVQINHDGIGKQLVYTMGRNIWSSITAIVVGSVFAAAGWYMLVKEGMTLFGSVFGGIGAIVALAALYMAFKSLEVTQEGNIIRSTRRWLGIPIRRREMRRDNFLRFEKNSSFQTQSGGKHVMYYSVRGIDRQANEVLLGEGFKGESGANAAIRFLSKELGLNEEQRESPYALDKSMFDKGATIQN